MNYRLFVIAVCLFGAFIIGGKSHAQNENAATLFSEPTASDAGLVGIHPNPVVVRHRTASITVGNLPTAYTAPGSLVEMNFFSDTKLDVVLDDVVALDDDRYLWKGQVFGQNGTSSVSLAVNDGVVVGNIRSKHGYFQIRTDASGVTVIREVDETQYPDCETDADQVLAADPLDVAGDVMALDGGETFDVLVVYTSAAKDAVGGTAEMEALIDLAIGETNEIYDNSLIASQVRLVHRQEVGYNEVSFGEDLNNLRGDGDGLLDEVHDLRDAYGADLVSMFVDSSGGCGIGYLMGTLSSGFESSAFNVVDWDCATGYYSFAHELGHNMGCHHAIPEASQGSALMPYSHGWRWTSAQGTQYRSVMAYSPGSRVNHFSNPDVQHQGEFTGQTIGASDQASNAASINYAASTVAGWRQAVDTISTVPSNSFDSSGMPGGPFAPDSATYTLVNGGSSPLSWTASASDTWFALSSNGGTLAAGETVELVIALNGAANALTSGNYSGSVTVTDTANAVSTTRYVNLTVLSPVQYQFTLDTDPGWSTSGAWAFGTPLGQGSHNRDPASGYTGDNVYGYNLAGDYTNDMAETSLTTSAFDFSTLTNTSIGFWRWLGLESSNYDHAAFQISTNGTTWIDLWTHGSGSFSDTAWSYHNYDISQYADNAPAVQFRWVMGETDISVTYPGWNIDDVVVRGTGTSSGLSEAWVDFQQASGGDGSADNPFNTVSDAVDALVDDGSGIIRFMGNPPTVSTAETLTITKPMTMQASSGTVRIGDTP